MYDPNQQQAVFSKPLSNYSGGICGINQNGRKHLVYSIEREGKLYQIDLHGDTSMEVYTDKDFEPSRLTNMTDDTILVVNNKPRPNSLSVLCVQSTPYVCKSIINTQIGSIFDLCFHPPTDTIICTAWDFNARDDNVYGVDATTGATRWRINNIDGNNIYPHGVCIKP